MLMLSNTKCTQIAYENRNAIPSFIHFGTVIEFDNYRKICRSNFTAFDPKLFHNQDHVLLVRQYALGDLIQLVYVARRMKKFYNIKKITIACASNYLRGLKACYPDIPFVQFEPNTPYEGVGVTMLLDGNLEKDHNPDNPASQVHRINIFNQTLGMPEEKKTNVEDWSFRNEGIKFEGDPGVKYIGLQIRGSALIKTLPYEYVCQLAKTLSSEYKVVLLDHDPSKGFEGPNIVNMCGKVDVQQCVSLLSHLSAVITMDSGMLWMAHSANVPTLLLLGSTREEERLSLHPLYPEKAKSISLSNMVNCKPCFETRIACKGKFHCMNNFPRELLTNQIQEILKIITSGEPTNGESK